MSTKVSLPESIKSQMSAWREGFCDMPAAYIAFHKDLAEKALTVLVAEHGLTVHSTTMKGDGWLDGMQVVTVVVEEKSGRLVKLSWHDGNQEFFERGCGSWPYRPNAKKAVSS
jgi:hypothetical protein